jgi:hypothetical protein
VKFWNLKERDFTEYILDKADDEIMHIVLSTFHDVDTILANTEIKNKDVLLRKYTSIRKFMNEEQKKIILYLNLSRNALGDDVMKYLQLNKSFVRFFDEMFLGWEIRDVMVIFSRMIYLQCVRSTKDTRFNLVLSKHVV